MKKIKKVWEENKVLLVLAVILIICLVVVAIVSLTYFYGSSDNVYGDRLNEIENTPISSKLLTDIESELKTNESVLEVESNVKGKIVYISIKFVEATKMEDAKVIAESVIELFNEDELSLYDINFTINSLSTTDFVGYTLMGSRNAAGNGTIVWNNYNIQEDTEEED